MEEARLEEEFVPLNFFELADFVLGGATIRQIFIRITAYLTLIMAGLRFVRVEGDNSSDCRHCGAPKYELSGAVS